MKKYFRNIISFVLLLVFTGIAVACVLVKAKAGHHQAIEFAQQDSNINALFYILAEEDENTEPFNLTYALFPNLIFSNAIIIENASHLDFYTNTILNKLKQRIPIFIQLRKLRL
jgi:hypothetical protein